MLFGNLGKIAIERRTKGFAGGFVELSNFHNIVVFQRLTEVVAKVGGWREAGCFTKGNPFFPVRSFLRAIIASIVQQIESVTGIVVSLGVCHGFPGAAIKHVMQSVATTFKGQNDFGGRSFYASLIEAK